LLLFCPLRICPLPYKTARFHHICNKQDGSSTNVLFYLGRWHKDKEFEVNKIIDVVKEHQEMSRKHYYQMLRLDRAMMGCDMAHTAIINVASFVRDDYMTHGLHLNSRGRRRLTHLIAERTSGEHM
jgi:hypothetical protein